MKTSSLVLGAFTLICNMALNNIPVKAQSSYGWLQQVEGSYQGRISDGSEEIPSTTEFIMTETGALMGSYAMKEEKGLSLGVLSHCSAVDVQLLHCLWNDRYGNGELDILFSDDFSNFDGTWAAPNLVERFAWKGSK